MNEQQKGAKGLLDLLWLMLSGMISHGVDRGASVKIVVTVWLSVSFVLWLVPVLLTHGKWRTGLLCYGGPVIFIVVLGVTTLFIGSGDDGST